MRVTTRGEARSFTVVGIARFGDVKSLGTATFAVFDLGAAQTLFHKQGKFDDILVAGRDGVPGREGALGDRRRRGLLRPGADGRRRRTASRSSA